MKYLETTFRAAQPSAGRFFYPSAGPLTLGPLTLPSPPWGEGEAAS
jgi:hypothetical protein